MDILNTIKTISQHNFDDIIRLRRHLHSFPELSFQEFTTSKRIAEELTSIGIPFFTGIAGTGIIAVIQGKKPGPTIGIRAELDALPVNEVTTLGFKSEVPNVMHACGHDVHMANLIGVAKVLWQLIDFIEGKVVLIFQPGEELLPGGAESVIQSEVFVNNKPDIMIGLHILPELNAGVVGFREGSYMASGDEIYITVNGKGGHAALPHTLIDPVLIASHILTSLQQIVSRKAPSQIPTVLSFGKVVANGANNVIPDTVTLEGTFRTMDESWRAKAHAEIERIASGIAIGIGGTTHVEIRKGYPALSNNERLTKISENLAKEYMDSPNSVVKLPIRMTTDDFARYAQQIPSVYFRVGSGFDNQPPHLLHSSQLLVNENVLQHSVGLTAWLIINLLTSGLGN